MNLASNDKDVAYSSSFDKDVESFVPKICAQLPDAFYSPLQAACSAPDGTLYVGGLFNNLFSNQSYSLASLAGLSPAGEVLPVAEVNGTVYAILCPTPDMLVLGGRFWSVNGIAVRNFAVLRRTPNARYGPRHVGPWWTPPTEKDFVDGRWSKMGSPWQISAAPRFWSGNNTNATVNSPQYAAHNGGHDALPRATAASDQEALRDEAMVLSLLQHPGAPAGEMWLYAGGLFGYVEGWWVSNLLLLPLDARSGALLPGTRPWTVQPPNPNPNPGTRPWTVQPDQMLNVLPDPNSKSPNAHPRCSPTRCSMSCLRWSAAMGW